MMSEDLSSTESTLGANNKISIFFSSKSCIFFDDLYYSVVA
jgi:hypothetical protein